MPFDLLIRNATVVRDDSVLIADIAVEGGRIVELAPGMTGDATETIDAAGLHALPGMIDPHVHFNEPGRSEWEGIATGSAALAAGGGTAFFDMPLNSKPPVLDGAAFDAKLVAMQAGSVADFGLWGGLTPANLDRLEELTGRGVVGFKAFMCDSGIDDFVHADDWTLFRGMHIAGQLDLIVAVHAENHEITAGLRHLARGQGLGSFDAYVRSRPQLVETEAIGRAIAVAEATRCRLHVVHVSTSRGVELVAEARRRGVDVTCETCGHYLALSSDDARRLGALAKCAPPIRGDEDRRALWDHLAAGRVDFVASDHSPAPLDMKSAGDFFDVWGGIAGVQSTLPILLTQSHVVRLDTIARATAGNVARRFGVAGKGSIAVGNDADVVLVDLRQKYELSRQDLLDRHKLSPFVGMTFRGQVRRTILRGQTTFLDGRVVAGPIGRLLRPGRTASS